MTRHTSGQVTLRSAGGAILRTRTANINDVRPHWYNTTTYLSSGDLFEACTRICTPTAG